jgi:hypothetical protein
MTPDRFGHVPTDQSPRAFLYFITAASVLLGLWGRFNGLGTLPLSADEYYIARSVENILRTGLPQWDCGGFYMRGLLFQYVLAPLQMAGMSAELSARFVAAVASVIALPAVYLLGRRVHGPTVGLLAVSVLALSAWEVDIARFGRMYAPFQAVFAWYLVYFLRHTVDADSRALRPMLILSVIGVLTWEGGLLMAFANLLPPFIRSPQGAFVARDFRYLALCATFAAVATLFTMTEMNSGFRHMGTDPFPPGFDKAEFLANLDDNGAADVPIRSGGHAGPDMRSPLAVTIGIALLALAAASLRWIWSLRRRWPAAVGLAVALAAALAHQFSLVAFTLVILLLARMLGWRDLFARNAWPFAAAIAACVVGWTIIGLLSPGWSASLTTPWRESSAMLSLAYEFLRLPDFVRIVALPFARAAPLLGAVLLAAIAIAVLRDIRRNSAAITSEQVLLLVLVGMLGAASFGHPPRLETRYVFFLFPGAVVIAVALAVRALESFAREPLVAAFVSTSLVAAGFALTGDFQPRRLIHIDDGLTRVARDSARRDKSNVMHRSDPRSAAQWLAEHVTGAESLVINGYPTVDFYYKDFDFTYIGLDNQRYWAYSCQRGTKERWGNLPLLSDSAGLDAQIARSDNAFIVIDTVSRDALLRDLAVWHPRVAWTSLDGSISILVIMRNQQT